ncbi:MAG: transglycosylase domain-containing protein [Actinomycetota bacterium]
MQMRRPMALGFLVLIAAGTACGLPQLASSQPRQLAQTSFLYAADGSLITELHAGEDRVMLGYTQMPQSIKDAVIAIEDQRFWYHHGVDGRALLRAAYINVLSGRIVEGGSTITQQLVKNLYVGDEQTFTRKIDEAALAWQIEDQLSKEQILARYLNTVYFGQGAYGVQAAAQTFFNENAEDLSLTQSATLAGSIAAPNDFDPAQHPQRAVRRRAEVLDAMLAQHMIDHAAYDHAVSQPIHLDPPKEVQRYPDPYFVDYFKEWFMSNPKFGTTRQDRYELLFSGGLRITTTLQPRLQSAAEHAVAGVLTYRSDPSGAMTVIDPQTGYVRAMVGGRNYWDDRSDIAKLNLATGGSSGRQAGSSFKPFALVAALENGISPQTVFPAPSSIQIPLDNGEVWPVSNAEGGSYGSLTLEQATIDSVNTVYAQLVERLGADKVVEVAKRMGIRCCRRVSEPSGPDSELKAYPSAVLGSNEVNTLEMASAYGTLATGGIHVQPTPVIRITDARGNTLYEAKPEGKRVVDPKIIAVADDILHKVVLYGTGTNANIGRPQIGKTGTEDNYKNAWFVGAIPQLTAAVWVGFPERNLSMSPPRTRITVFGGTWPAQIWRLFMTSATKGMEKRDFPTPDVSYVNVAVDVTQDPLCVPNQFTLPQNIDTLPFIQGTEPTKICREPSSAQQVSVPSVIGMLERDARQLLERAGFYVELRLQVSTQPVGTVVGQTPQAGTLAYQTSTVTITVSKDTSQA